MIRPFLALLLAALMFLHTRPGLADAVSLDDRATLTERLHDGGAYALLIGISDYETPGWSRLSGVASEIDMIRSRLIEQGFAVTEPAQNGRLTRAELGEAIGRFLASYGGQGSNRLIIYYAGHGLADEQGNGLLIASDSLHPNDKEHFLASTYQVEELSNQLARLKARHVFLFFNACFGAAMVPVWAGEDARGGPGLNAAGHALRLLDAEARMILTAGNALQEVPDRDNPFARAVDEGLAGKADLDRDGLILGTELAQYIRTEVSRATLARGKPNDPVFALFGGRRDRPGTRPAMDGDFVFMTPSAALSDRPLPDSEAVLEARRARLSGGQFTECADCPVMIDLPRGEGQPALAMARTETTFAEWDACYRDFGCSRFIPDHGQGRGDRPVSGVTWQDALEFTSWMQSERRGICRRYRLPALSEWQAAAGETRADLAVCDGCEALGGLSAKAAPRAGSLPGNNSGLQDMAGSLWEWTAEGEPCPLEPGLVAQGCEEPGTLVGGAWSTAAAALAAAAEGASFPRSGNRRAYSLPTVGFRVICEKEDAT